MGADASNDVAGLGSERAVDSLGTAMAWRVSQSITLISRRGGLPGARCSIESPPPG